MSPAADHLLPYLIVGLGNPGLEYKNTRHNIGFEVVNGCARNLGPAFEWKNRLRFAQGQGHFRGAPLILLKPRTWMNHSGEAVRAVATAKQIPSDRILIIADDIATPLGSLRLRLRGSSGGHNGLKSVEHSLQTPCFARLRVGIGQPGDQPLDDFVLGKFTNLESGCLPPILEQAAAAALRWTCEDHSRLMSDINSWKYQD